MRIEPQCPSITWAPAYRHHAPSHMTAKHHLFSASPPTTQPYKSELWKSTSSFCSHHSPPCSPAMTPKHRLFSASAPKQTVQQNSSSEPKRDDIAQHKQHCAMEIIEIITRPLIKIIQDRPSQSPLFIKPLIVGH